MLQIVQKMFLLVFKIKNIVPWTYVMSDFNGERIVGSFYQKNCKKLIKNNLEQKKNN